MSQKNYDVIIVGGGIIGSSTAYYLMKMDDKLNVCVVEKDPSYEKSSTTLSMANARIQFSFKENVEISQYAFDVLENFENDMAVNDNKPNILYRREGNLFIVNDKGEAGAKKAVKMQKGLGCQVDWWSPAEIKERYPLFDTSEYAGGTFGPQDGHFDAYAVLMGYKAKARSLGAEYLHDEVTEICAEGGRVTGVKSASGETLTSKIVINCAGAWAAQIAKTAGIELPIDPVKRQVFAVDTAVKPEGPLPLTILPGGLYFRTETGGLILVGKSNEDDPIGFNFNHDDHLFMNNYWPELAEFVPAFEELRLVRGWAGLYAVNTLDENAILGEWPELGNFFLANGFSGHGVQQAPAVGRYIAELITGSTLSMDLSLFRPERILEGKPIQANGGWEIV
jgi:FAD-dependent oxidoreductase domain-containing protein 1